jgi:4-hydroxy-3-polyprenylbenzoate decarboxylase
MGYRSLRDCLHDLQWIGQLLRIDDEIDPHLEMAAIHRRVYQAGGPALYFARVKGSRFPMASNLFGTPQRVRYVFRHTFQTVQRLVALQIDPAQFFKRPWRFLGVPRAIWNLRPRWVRRAPVLARETTISQLPQLVCWPGDGGAFVTLPEVYTEDANRPGWRHSNLGMYRIQLSGNDYRPDEEVGLHYQLHRGIGNHHAAALGKGVPFRVNVLVGGPPALAVAAVMPLPEGLPELAFAGVLGGRRVALTYGSARDGSRWPLPIAAEADFCITGTVEPGRLLPEGPFGDHLGYYSLKHLFPVLKVERVYHRSDAVWPFTVVGRPPQEDTAFGQFVHELTGPVIPTVVRGIHAVHAVDAAGVHPLLLAIGSERYAPFEERRRPQELLTGANALLGQGQLSLAKYLLIVAREDDPNLDIHDIPAFFTHLLRRVDWTQDLHFQTRTTIDTLDYSGSGLNEGSKVVIAAVGPPRRELLTALPMFEQLPKGFAEPRLCLPGVVALRAPAYPKNLAPDETDRAVKRFCEFLTPEHPLCRFPLLVLVDDSDFAARHLNNFLWVTFTRSNPAADLHGVGAFTAQKHWGCTGPLVLDARLKPHHAPPLEEDPDITRRINALAAPGKPLHRII